MQIIILDTGQLVLYAVKYSTFHDTRNIHNDIQTMQIIILDTGQLVLYAVKYSTFHDTRNIHNDIQTMQIIILDTGQLVLYAVKYSTFHDTRNIHNDIQTMQIIGCISDANHIHCTVKSHTLTRHQKETTAGCACRESNLDTAKTAYFVLQRRGAM